MRLICDIMPPMSAVNTDGGGAFLYIRGEPMELIDNKAKLLGDDLKKEIKSGAKIKIVASYFSIYVFEALKDELLNIDELQFIFPSPTFVQQGVKDNIKKETREYFIPKRLRENSLYGTEFEIRPRNQLTQKVIAKECTEWVREKVKFRSNITDGGLQNFIYIENVEKKAIYFPIEGFTFVDLGYEKNNMMYQGRKYCRGLSKLQDAINSL